MIYTVKEPLIRPPTHPGAILLEDVLPALKLSVKEAAAHLRISRQTLHKIMAEKASVTPEMALKLARFCGGTPSFWLRMQQNFDLWHAEKKIAPELKLIQSHGDLFATS
ncbi:MAG: HigA family addiction module antidote protein [Alphaproteobacteria bacterium]|nr:HigA family addiction module antidote protein [Alphaproteobacteria bacterium]